MTHLKIEQNNGITEQVSPSVIEKLYEIVHSGNLDSSSNLIGSLNTTSTYQDYVDYLEEQFTKNGVRQLIITANKLYISFNDPAVESYWANSVYGDGTGITTTSAATITTIYNNPFFGNTDITNLDGMQYFINCTDIGQRFAMNATNLTSFIAPPNLTSLSHPGNLDPAFLGAFRGCSSLSNVVLNEGLEMITNQCFSGCTSLTTIDIPSTVTKLASNTSFTEGSYSVFYGCSALQTVTGGEGIIVLGPSAFNGCSNLRSISDIDFSQITHIGELCFKECQNLELGSVNLQNITTLWNGTFYNCKKLTSLNIPNVTEIKDITNFLNEGACRKCTGLTTVTTGQNLSKVGSYAFQGCSALTTIGDLSGVTTIGNNAFEGCSSLTSVGNLSNVTTIGANAFKNCSSLTTVGDLSNVTTIQGSAFEGCTSLTAINFNHNNVTFDGHVTFHNCTSLTTVTGAENVITFSHNTFNGCTNLKNITVGENTDIAGGIFQNCSNLEKVQGAKFGKVCDNNFIENTFSGCSKLKCIDFYFQSSAVTYDGLFSGCSQLQDLTTNDPNSINTGEQTYTFQNVTRLHSGVFFGTTSLINKIFVFPSLTSITGQHCFSNCGAKSFSAPLLTSLGAQSFASSNFQTVSIPSVTSLPEESFLNASQLQSIELLSVTSIGKDTFKNCTALTTVKVGSNLTTMGQTPFTGCTSLTTIYVPSAKLSDYQTSFPDIASMMVSY